jgi:S1-C subfamily serine protease
MTRGGVVPGDVIVAVEGRDLRDVNDLRAVLDERAPGDVVTVLVERGGDRREVEVELAAGEG